MMLDIMTKIDQNTNTIKQEIKDKKTEMNRRDSLEGREITS